MKQWLVWLMIALSAGLGAGTSLEAQHLTWLGSLSGNGDLYHSYAYGVSADGSVVVGASDSDNGTRAFRWTASGGMEDLNITYAGVLTDGSLLVSAFAISPDGRYIAGRGNSASQARMAMAVLMTVTCWRCCLRSARRAPATRATRISTKTASWTTQTC